MSEPQPTPPFYRPAPLYHEDGASWSWVLLGPAAAAAMLLIYHWNGYGLQLLVPGVFLVLVSGFIGLQVKAARVHTSVELTEDTLRQGTEILRIGEIVSVYPEAEQSARDAEKTEKWQTARALGELSGIPRGRIGIGLGLSGGRTAQAWARHHRVLRAALTAVLQQRDPELAGPPEPAGPSGPDDDGDGTESTW